MFRTPEQSLGGSSVAVQSLNINSAATCCSNKEIETLFSLKLSGKFFIRANRTFSHSVGKVHLCSRIKSQMQCDDVLNSTKFFRMARRYTSFHMLTI
jgi:hypothetical protein